MATVGEVKDLFHAFERGLLGWPTCSICNKPVDKMEMKLPSTNSTIDVAVWCHGKTEIIRIGRDIFADIIGGVSFGGWAFEQASKQKNLLDKPPPIG